MVDQGFCVLVYGIQRDFKLHIHGQYFDAKLGPFMGIKAGMALSLESPLSLLSITVCSNLYYFAHEFYQQETIAPVTSRENQTYSVVTGVTVTALSDSPVKDILFSAFDI